MAHLNSFITCVNTDADQAEKSSVVDVKSIALIHNVSDAVITFSFDAASATTDDVIILDAGAKIEDLDIPCYTLYYKATSADNKNFRFIGLKERN